MTPARVALGIGVVCAVLASVLPARAQSLTFGAKGGLGLSKTTFSGGFAEDTSFAPGLVGGGVAGWTVTDRLSVRGEGLFVSERVTFGKAITDDLNYLDIPLLGRYEVLTVAGHRVAASGGYVYRHLLDATENIGGEASSIKNGLASSGGALAVGADLQVTAHLRAGARYVHGQTGVYRRVNGGTTGRGRAWQFTAEWMFR